jgi:beta-mannosidase
MFAYRGWRRQWGQERRCGGALVWQLNDCWPVTSWAIIDYFLRKKPAYYAMSRVLTPIAVGVRRKHHDWSVCHARPAKTLPWELWVSSSRTTDAVIDIELRFVSIATGKDIKKKISKSKILVGANGSTDVAEGVIDNVNEEPHVLAAKIWIDGVCVSRDMDWPQPLKYLDFKNRGVSVEVHDNKLSVTVERPTKGFTFEEREGVLLSDSAIDLVPGDTQVVKFRGLKDGEKPLSWRYLGQNN